MEGKAIEYAKKQQGVGRDGLLTAIIPASAVPRGKVPIGQMQLDPKTLQEWNRSKSRKKDELEEGVSDCQNVITPLPLARVRVPDEQRVVGGSV